MTAYYYNIGDISWFLLILTIILGVFLESFWSFLCLLESLQVLTGLGELWSKSWTFGAIWLTRATCHLVSTDTISVDRHHRVFIERHTF
ncbi:unnamed protein product [Arabidopsis halleri]